MFHIWNILHEIVLGASLCINILIVSFYVQMSGEIPGATSDTQSVQTTSGPLGQSENVHSRPYIDPKQPGMELACFMVRMNTRV